jgi:hemolysin-activating ACP:hemolysin acyltransferase
LHPKDLTLQVIGTCVWAGVDNAWEQEKLEARKMLENAAESHTSGARFVRRSFARAF